MKFCHRKKSCIEFSEMYDLISTSDKCVSVEYKIFVFLPISFNMFWVVKKIVSLRRFFSAPQHMFWLRNKKNEFLLRCLP